jgi:phosphatidylethanolamine/phosphatidyl-N-methylethanolamine N-methyltransferase
MKRSAHSLRFLKEFLFNHQAIGAVWPTSPTLASAMVSQVDLKRAKAVLEYGPGVGVFTRLILQEIDDQCKFVAFENNPEMIRIFKENFPNAPLYEGSVADVEEVCRNRGIEKADAIISGLPWAAFSEELQTELLQKTVKVLAADGHFMTFAYLHGVSLPAGQRFAALLPRYFSQVRKTKVVWRNVPPAFIYHCQL